MQRTSKTCFYDDYDGEFGEYLGRVEFDFKDKCPEYEECFEKEEKILDKYPNLRQVIDDREYSNLTSKEITALIQILDIRDQRQVLFESLMFFRGCKEMYNILKKFDII